MEGIAELFVATRIGPEAMTNDVKVSSASVPRQPWNTQLT
jgi:hypothetical protein